MDGTPAPAKFVTLRAKTPRVALPTGCLTMLGGPMMAIGLWFVGVAVFIGPDERSMRAQIAIGAAIAAAGLAILAAAIRKNLGAMTPTPEVALEAGHRLTPGAIVPFRIRFRARARLTRLKVALVCERRYVDQETAPGTMSVTPVERVETLTTQDLLEVRGLSLNRRIPWERTASVVVPYLAKPSGPVLPSGVAEWFIDVFLEPAIGKPVHDRFDLVVVLSDAPETPIQPSGQRALSSGRPGRSMLEKIGPGAGCAVVALAFLLVGPIFLWLYFSDAPTKRGNPVMALVAGILFTGLGLAAVSSLVRRSIRPNNWRGRTHDPRRLP